MKNQTIELDDVIHHWKPAGYKVENPQVFMLAFMDRATGMAMRFKLERGVWKSPNDASNQAWSK